MIYIFDNFELDAEKVELRKEGTRVALEPQVLSLLMLLLENRERMVSKDEIIETIWNGRIVSESAVTSRIKSARRALGDDGKSQRYIRTIHGSGFRFVAEALRKDARTGSITSSGSCQGLDGVSGPEAAAAKPSIAILPFRLVGNAGPYATIADALPHELIAELSRLRWLFVIARGSSFRFRAAEPDILRVGEALNVRYCLSGAVEIAGKATNVTVELAATRNGEVIWGERFASEIGDIFEIRTRIVASIVSALEIQIPLNEARAARLRGTENLDAWSAYHLGLQHMFRFNCEDNTRASLMFERALAQDPGFARAHAGRSFTHFQNAFLRYSKAPAADAAQARRSAERSIELDPLDPFANFAMGRVYWLEGDLDGSLGWLRRATTLSPNYAHGVYARAWADTVSGRALEGQTNADLAMSLSPLDPLLYAMMGTRALSHLVRGDGAEAAKWADRAARAPGAHVLIGMIAVLAHSLNGDDERAAAWARNVRSRNAKMTQREFLRSFPFADERTRRSISGAFAKAGL
jgi:TolB-like protein/virulence-associated protein VagC